MLTNRFKAFEHGMREIEKTLTRWDRTIGKSLLSLCGERRGMVLRTQGQKENFLIQEAEILLNIRFGTFRYNKAVRCHQQGLASNPEGKWRSFMYTIAV